MKTVVLFLVLILCIGPVQAKPQHNSIYTVKVKRIINAMGLSEVSSELEYYKKLREACKNNQCNAMETRAIQDVGQQIVYCKLDHLKAHGINNSDAQAVCGSKMAMLACDTLANSLLRKMCYTSNQYSLKLWQQKELKYKSRMPASEKK